jgi:LmbE family N-acetylglucosaminyl deacetylase
VPSLGTVPTVLHVSPHPDDEALGAPATLLLLRRAGWRVVNVVARVGQPTDHARRRAEAIDATERAGFELMLPDDRDFSSRLAALVRAHRPEIVVSPWPDDVQPTHEAVARTTGDTIASCEPHPVWWQWGLWADLRAPTLYVPFDASVLADAQHVLAAYTGELARNDYARLLEARAVAHAVLGSERVFGFGRGRASTPPYAELLTEMRRVRGTWEPGAPRVLDPTRPLVS